MGRAGSSNATINVTTNNAGRYSAPLLKPSKYEVSATASPYPRKPRPTNFRKG
jgi:hypothetical protein